MATYTITINEKTDSGKTLLAYLVSLGLIKEKKAAQGIDLTTAAIDEINNGGGNHYSNFEDFEQKMNEI